MELGPNFTFLPRVFSDAEHPGTWALNGNKCVK